MFESLTVPPKGSRPIAQPVLSFALHAGLIALAIGQYSGQVPQHGDFDLSPAVIYVPDGPGTTSKVATRSESPLPRPVCECPVSIPGPVTVPDPTGRTEPIPGLPVSNPYTRSGGPILDSAQPGQVGPYREGDLSDSPEVQHFPDPVYPPALRAARVEGAVQVMYVVNALGGVEAESITIVSSDHPSMADAVRLALLQARFHPGKVRGIPVRSLVRQTIRFSLMPL